MRYYKTVTAALFALSFAACTNPEVSAGHEGYVYHVPLVFGQMEYRDSLEGPASTGVSWRLYIEAIDMRTQSYTEDFQLLTKDNLSVSFEVNTRISLSDGSVKEVVEQWGGKKWYEWNVKEPLRTIVREQVTQFSATTLQLETPKVRVQVETKLGERYMNPDEPTPIVIESVDIGEIQFPPEVAEAIQRKIATKQELERQRFLLSKTEKEAAIKVLEAINVAKQQLIISSTLDPLYVQQRAVQVYRSLAESPNRTVLMLPNTPDGTGMPLILEPKTRRILSASDKATMSRKLDALEGEYTERAQDSKTMDAAADDATDPGLGLPADGDVETDGEAAPGGEAEPGAGAAPTEDSPPSAPEGAAPAAPAGP